MKITQKTQNQPQQQIDDEVFASCSFSSLGLQPSLCDQLKERLGFEGPTQVQAQAIPVILSGRHVLVNAVTGSGKTVAYLAPIIHHLQKYEPRIQRTDGTFGITILVATPGRLLDHLKNTSSFLHTNLRWLIFDEADRILELGYGKEIEEILDYFGSRKNRSNGQESGKSNAFEFQRQNLLLSATLNEKVNHLAKISLEDPVMIGLAERKPHQNPSSVHFGSEDEEDEEDEAECSGRVTDSSSGDYNLPSQLIQKYVKVPCGARLAVLLSILKNLFEREATQKVVVFFSTCDAVDFHYALLKEFQWPPNSVKESEEKRLFMNCKTFRLHGNMKNEERRTTFHSFKTEKSALLLSSDVAARGLDFPKVRCIIQYDSPGEATEYVHRVGRTARLGQKGDSLLFLQPIEMDYLQDLEKHNVSLAEYPLQKVMDSFPLYGQKHLAKRLVSIEMHPWLVGLQKALEACIYTESKLSKMAKSAFVSWIRAYTAHRGELKRIFTMKNLHLGHVAKSFALKDQPSLVGKSVHQQLKKRKKSEQKRTGQWKKRRVTIKT